MKNKEITIFTVESLTNIIIDYLRELQLKGRDVPSVKVFSIGSNEFVIEPYTTGFYGKLDGMQIIYNGDKDGTFEVSEYMAGENQDELHIYKDKISSFKIAIKEMLKGNKRKPIKIWN